ncbi:29 kDa ribonucleoprotein A, chloroplastic [Tanacetum coccineum]
MGMPIQVCVRSCHNISAPASRPFRYVKLKRNSLVIVLADLEVSRVEFRVKSCLLVVLILVFGCFGLSLDYGPLCGQLNNLCLTTLASLARILCGEAAKQKILKHERRPITLDNVLLQGGSIALVTTFTGAKRSLQHGPGDGNQNVYHDKRHSTWYQELRNRARAHQAQANYRHQRLHQESPIMSNFNQESPMLLNHSNRAGARTFTRQTAAHHRGPHCCASDAQPIHLRDLNGQQPAASNRMPFDYAYLGKCSRVIYYKVSGTSRGFGFVTMSSVEEVEEAVRNFNGYVSFCIVP